MSHAGLVPAALILLLTISQAPRESAAEPPERPKVGKPHPPLALWTIEHDRPISLASLRGQKVLLIHFASWNPECRNQVSGWFERMKPLVAAKKLVVLGVDHEQHADRARLFAQWKGIQEPVLHDALDLSVVTHVPMVVGIDEEGVVRVAQPSIDKIEKSFVNRRSPKKKKHSSEPEEAVLPDPRVTRRTAEEARMPGESRAHADALVLSGLPPQIEEAVKVYRQVIDRDPKDAWSFFRLGVVYRIRHEREERQAGDFQAAVDAWEEAARLAPTCDVFQQRLRQYGPSVELSGASYDWIPVAQNQIVRRGQKPIELAIEPLAIELTVGGSPSGPHTPSISRGKASTDKEGLVQIEPTVVRAADRKHAGTMEVHLTFRPNGAPWDNHAEPLRVWLEKSKNARPDREFFEVPNPKSETSQEARTVSFKVESKGKSKEKATLKGYAVYCIHAGSSGKAQTLRQEFKVAIGEKVEQKIAGPSAKPTGDDGDARARGE